MFRLPAVQSLEEVEQSIFHVRAALSHLRQAKNRLIAIHRLSDRLLARIFRDVLIDAQHKYAVPSTIHWTGTEVCKRWHAIFRARRDLLSFIRWSPQAMHNPDTVFDYLRCSVDEPLHVLLHIEQSSKKALQALVDQSPRFISLALIEHRNANLFLALDALQDNGDLHLLRTLTLSQRYRSHFYQAISRPLLDQCRYTLTTLRLEGRFSLDLRAIPMVQSLYLEDVRTLPAWSEPRQFLLHTSRLERLTSLTLGEVSSVRQPEHLDANPSERVHLGLRKIRLIGLESTARRILVSLSLPYFSTLNLECSDSDEWQAHREVGTHRLLQSLAGVYSELETVPFARCRIEVRHENLFVVLERQGPFRYRSAQSGSTEAILVVLKHCVDKRRQREALNCFLRALDIRHIRAFSLYWQEDLALSPIRTVIQSMRDLVTINLFMRDFSSLQGWIVITRRWLAKYKGGHYPIRHIFVEGSIAGSEGTVRYLRRLLHLLETHEGRGITLTISFDQSLATLADPITSDLIRYVAPNPADPPRV